ncbi:NAD(P)/FAD-dependent oxidoreductase [Dethiosulfatarculus sandiegensis]|uniref:Thioredoxin reductase n=1 Tax=Dethiosulfatarculus sandiegensis TaxID=1429043 RepID=A0A0D2JU15_9BACT|nr:FAD-dependent oxidoreductase [Dethiosulfatarculus sandiegensis]KIX12970.1 thioredoxin reductase [Dethiosulfatarculus sandiegensis]
MDNQYDVIILGGGIASMTAAIYTAQANLKTVILEKSICGGLVNTTFKVTNFPSKTEISGQELMEQVRDQVEALGVDIREVIEVDSISLKGDLKVAQTDEGNFSAPVMILATGRKPKALPIGAECEQIHYCAICDGSAYKGKRVLVVGGGNSGVEESQYLLSSGVAHITLIEQMGRLFASKQSQAELRSHGNKVDVHLNTLVEAILTKDGKLTQVQLKNTETDTVTKLNIDGIFIYMGHDPQNGLFSEAVSLTPQGYINAGAHMETNIPGVFAAGDIVHKKYRQITTAMHDGTIAALSSADYIRKIQHKI